MRIKYILFLLIASSFCRAQTKVDPRLIDFSISWKADSLGSNGFRESHYSFSKKPLTWLINGMSFKGYTEAKVINILGKPTQSGHHKEDHCLIMAYIIRKKGVTPEIELLIYFNKKEVVDDIVEETGL